MLKTQNEHLCFQIFTYLSGNLKILFKHLKIEELMN